MFIKNCNKTLKNLLFFDNLVITVFITILLISRVYSFSLIMVKLILDFNFNTQTSLSISYDNVWFLRIKMKTDFLGVRLIMLRFWLYLSVARGNRCGTTSMRPEKPRQRVRAGVARLRSLPVQWPCAAIINRSLADHLSVFTTIRCIKRTAWNQQIHCRTLFMDNTNR